MKGELLPKSDQESLPDRGASSTLYYLCIIESKRGYWTVCDKSMQEEFLTRILDIVRRLAENRSLDPLLEYAMNEALALFKAEFGFLILLREDGSLDFRVKRASDGRSLDQPEREISQTILQQVIKSQEDLIVASALEDSDFQHAHSVVAMKLRSVLCVPMVTRGHTIGALYLENRSGSNIFTRDDLPAVKLFASQAAIAIENAQLNDELEQRVSVRTAELQNLVNELHAFSSTVAHDLKIPLTVISGYAAALLRSSNTWSVQQQSHLKIIRTKAQGMAETIDALLLLARVRELDEVDIKPLNMSTILKAVLVTLAPSIEESKAVVLAPTAWPVAVGFAPWVQEVWLNYLNNAIKYGGKPPRLELGAEAEGNGFIRFWVRDNGLGLQVSDPQELFVPFTRLQNVDVEGYGLGLSIVQRIVTKLGGEVAVESELGTGSVFSFTLPAGL